MTTNGTDMLEHFQVTRSEAEEFDRLMARAHLDLRAEWRDAMLTEFAQMRAELKTIHAFANAHDGVLDLRQVITFGRVET